LLRGSRNNRRLSFFRGRTVAKVETLSAPTEGGEPQPLGIDMHGFYLLNLHADGKLIIFADEQWNHYLSSRLTSGSAREYPRGRQAHGSLS
jgi:hypothetical protein